MEQILCVYTLAELRQLAVYLSEFQNCAFIWPEDVKRKKSWLNSTSQMLIQKNPENPRDYISRLRCNIRWFIDHKIKFKRGMAESNSFFEKMVYTFKRNITETIYLEFNSSNFITIQKEDIILPDDINFEFENYPNTLRPATIDDDLTQSIDLLANYFETIDISRNVEIIDLTTSTTATSTTINDEEVTDDARGLECKICANNKICIVLSRCGHTFCHSCTTRFENKCGMCRTPFTNSTKIRMYI
ncbi:E3 ubiquitin-protein ligase LINCR-like [Invertebrate iridescent virus 22]|uniref:E3 ubiquitin-protein ligase LINCR-like n=1 Tax=Invertebrate iridescent virus 22 TaxID=345198 RepID=S6DF27_9VIRU|nr:E3 ubiquitin-protein ligase LINCR-like [Invertebrate iridescent virus 22]CCV01705.1 E3 ubiquitin-protein ligase LINCR-like [Invertebrate iridescent virus 22]